MTGTFQNYTKCNILFYLNTQVKLKLKDFHHFMVKCTPTICFIFNSDNGVIT